MRRGVGRGRRGGATPAGGGSPRSRDGDRTGRRRATEPRPLSEEEQMQTKVDFAPRAIEAPAADEPVVKVERLSKRFGDILAVDDLSFALERGTVTGFLGPNGAGKTTTLRMLLHLVEPSAGRALVFGGRYVDLERPASRVGAVLEAADFHPGRSGYDH